MQNDSDTITVNGADYVRKNAASSASEIFSGDFQPFEIGSVYLIRTVTMIQVGRVVAASAKWVMLEDAAWVADTGRFSDALASWNFDEVEPFPDGFVGVSCGAIVDFVKGLHVLRVKK